MIEVLIVVNERNVCAGRTWPALASAGQGKILAQVTAPLPMPPLAPTLSSLYSFRGQAGRAELRWPGLHLTHAWRIVRVQIFSTSVQSPAEMSRVL
jgi:hypothetical protein